MLIMERPFATGPKRGDVEGKAHAVLSQKHPAAFPSLVTDAAVRTANLFELPDEHRDPPSYSAAMPKAGVMASRTAPSTMSRPAENTSSSMVSGERTFTTSRSEEHTSELQSLMRISNAVFCWKK